MAVQPSPKIVVEKHEDYRTIIQSGVMGGYRLGFFEWVVYSDEMVTEDALTSMPGDPSKIYIKRTIECRLILTPVVAKSLLDWLNSYIDRYEKEFGKITLEKKVKGKEPPPSTYR